MRFVALTIAALFVAADGPYALLPNVEIWTEASGQQSLLGGPVHRDAREYRGPHPVVAHPPCERWGRYWHGGPSAKEPRTKGDDDGCFKSALRAVRAFGGVLEHPEASAAWSTFGLNVPPRTGGWIQADDFGGSTCCVEQGHYGHRARKATWLYAWGAHMEGPRDLPVLRWGPSENRARLDVGFHTAEERARGKALGLDVVRGAARLSARECWETPAEFRDVLLAIARSVYEVT